MGSGLGCLHSSLDSNTNTNTNTNVFKDKYKHKYIGVISEVGELIKWGVVSGLGCLHSSAGSVSPNIVKPHSSQASILLY